MEHNDKRIISFCITGTDKANKRFKIERANYFHIACINVWKGTLWGILSNGRRTRLRVYNN